MLNRLRKEQKGLTLIELIVVVAIIGILAWLITPRVLEALNTSKKNSAVSLANEIQSAMERYAAEWDSKYMAKSTSWDDFKSDIGSFATFATSGTDNINTGTFVMSPSGTTPPTFCISFNAKDRETTLIRITQTGIVSTGATACTP